jgi:hypothetical protein
MTLCYLEITQKDLQHEFHLARQNPRHLIPLPASATAPDPETADAPAVLQRLDAAIRVMDLFRQQNASSGDKTLKLLLRRPVRIRSRFENFDPGAKPEK